MPNKPLKPCKQLSCINLTRNNYCDEHIKTKPDYDKHRGTAAQRGYGSRWRKVRQQYLMTNHTCLRCGALATVIDHIQPHGGDTIKFWDQSNWQPLCKSCHDRKTATEDGGFGR